MTTQQRADVLAAFLEDPEARRYGYELMKVTHLASGTLYPLLTRLQTEGVIASEWEAPSFEVKKPRRYYRLTGEGARAARLELAEFNWARSRTEASGHGSVRPARSEGA